MQTFVNRPAYCCGYCGVEYQSVSGSGMLHPVSDCVRSGRQFNHFLPYEPYEFYDSEYRYRVCDLRFVKVEVGSDEYNVLVAEKEAHDNRLRQMAGK